MRKSAIYLIFTAFASVILCMLLFVHPAGTANFKEKLAEERRLARELYITDLCLFTEARYTRHITQADLHAPFQDHPLSLEHFPSGSIVVPPLSFHDGITAQRMRK